MANRVCILIETIIIENRKLSEFGIWSVYQLKGLALAKSLSSSLTDLFLIILKPHKIVDDSLFILGYREQENESCYFAFTSESEAIIFMNNLNRLCTGCRFKKASFA